MMKNKKVDLDIKPSLVAQFDDLMCKSKILCSGCEAEFVVFALNQDEGRRRWLEAEQKNESVEDKLNRLEQDSSTLETQLKHARMQAEYELQRRKAAEHEKEDMDRQIAVIRELLNDKNSKSILHENDRERLAAFANSRQQSNNIDVSNNTRLNTIMERSASFLSDVSYDKTEEDLLSDSRLRSGKNWKRASAPLEEPEGNTPPKRHRNEEDLNSSLITATLTIDTAGKPTATVETYIVPKLNKSFSEPTLDKHGDPKNACGADSDDEVWARSNINDNAKMPRKSILKSMPKTPSLRKANSAGRGLNRVHLFISKTVLKPETCVPCGNRIRFSKPAVKCKDCRAICHPDCKDKLPLPCIPSCPSTPGNKQLSEGVISDYAPSERPMIPLLIVKCASEVCMRGLEEVGIYRVPGSDREQKELKEKFLKGRHPNLSNIHDIHVVCGCLKDFLRGLKEPLVTYNLWDKFVKASTISSQDKRQEKFMYLVTTLPQANQDTLAYMLQHLQIVSTSPACKMPASNLAKIFGPTIVGYSSAQLEPMQMMMETRNQAQVMECLLEISRDFWSDMLCVDDMSLFPAGHQFMPGSPFHAAPRSMLGPINTPDLPEEYTNEVSRSHRLWKEQTTPRYANKTQEPKKPGRFFSSPLVN